MKKWILFIAVMVIIASCGYNVAASEAESNTFCPKDTAAQTLPTQTTSGAKVYSNSIPGDSYSTGSGGGRIHAGN